MWLHIRKWESYKRGGDFPIWVVSVTLVVISLGIVFESLNCHAELKVMLNLIQHLTVSLRLCFTASLTCPCPLTDPETSSG